jgi:hypothetical protein
MTSKYTFSDIKSIISEAKASEYEKFIKTAMKKFKIKDLGALDDKETVKFFNWIDKNWDAKNESVEGVDEALSIAGRRKLSQSMKKNAKKNAKKRKLSMSKKASVDTIKSRATKAAIKKVKSKLLKGQDEKSLSPSAKDKLADKLKQKSGLIKKLTKKLIPVTKAAEKDRLSKKSDK